VDHLQIFVNRLQAGSRVCGGPAAATPDIRSRGVNKDNAADYAAAGADLLVTLVPYYAKPADVKVILNTIAG
jgi:hypothetical protein